jgi:hypothetical protein
MDSDLYVPGGIDPGEFNVPVHVKPDGPAATTGVIAKVSAPPPAMAVAASIDRSFMIAPLS